MINGAMHSASIGAGISDAAALVDVGTSKRGITRDPNCRGIGPAPFCVDGWLADLRRMRVSVLRLRAPQKPRGEVAVGSSAGAASFPLALQSQSARRRSTGGAEALRASPDVLIEGPFPGLRDRAALASGPRKLVW